MNKNFLPILTLIAGLLATGIACSISVGVPTATPIPTSTPTPVFTSSPSDFINSLEQPTIDAAAGTATIVLNEEQITSYVDAQLKSDPNPVLRDPQISLENNQIIIRGTIVMNGVSVFSNVTATVTVGADGLPKTNIVSADIGSFPVPSPLLSAISSMIDQGITENVDMFPNDYRLESISIGNHIMTIVFKKK